MNIFRQAHQNIADCFYAHDLPHRLISILSALLRRKRARENEQKKKRVEKMKWNLTRLMLQCWNQSPNKWNLFWLLEQWTLSGGCHRGSSNDRGLCGINKHPKFVISFFLASILSSACSAAFPLHLTDFFFVCVETHVTWTMSKNTTQIDVIKSRS